MLSVRPVLSSRRSDRRDASSGRSVRAGGAPARFRLLEAGAVVGVVCDGPDGREEIEAGAVVGQGVNFLTNSSGLGLFFASEVAKMHKRRQRGGSIRLENGGPLGGGCFVLTLP